MYQIRFDQNDTTLSELTHSDPILHKLPNPMPSDRPDQIRQLRSDLIRPDLIQPDLIQPDLIQTDLIQPDLIRPDPACSVLIRLDLT